MFGTLPKFERYDYAKEHPLVTFQTIYDEEPVYYVPVSVFNASMLPDHSRYFDITQIVFPDDEAGGGTDSWVDGASGSPGRIPPPFARAARSKPIWTNCGRCHCGNRPWM